MKNLCLMCRWLQSIDIDGHVDCVKKIGGKPKIYCSEFTRNVEIETKHDEFYYLLSMGSKLGEYAGKWIAVVGREIVAVGDNAKEVYDIAKNKYPNKTPLIAKIPKDSIMLFEIGHPPFDK